MESEEEAFVAVGSAKAGSKGAKAGDFEHTFLSLQICAAKVVQLNELSGIIMHGLALRTGKMHGWSNARAFSATQLRTNPNAYFYRHVAPDQEQVVATRWPRP